jgi:hypothetical protein
MAGIWLSLTRDSGKPVLVNMDRIDTVAAMETTSANQQCHTVLEGRGFEIRVRETFDTVDTALRQQINCYQRWPNR